ncbi:rho GTPase-activating protein SYDE2 isoform X3 [Denticeps clupeoides]|uniref:rho GTPase-activating protein SYDE2 isoform X3 n=1 Tax=Denticeps clupeoides TaxID=299321 RepID=UPI0010A4588B|nr:rho GTPase-activating protein SYDE2 isoform X3 [Denticeps clupeoides]
MADPLRRTILAKLRGRKAKPVATEALIENVQREGASVLRARLNTITVSKKQYWLQQSSGKPHSLEETVADEENQTQSSTLLPENQLRPAAPSHPLLPHMPSVTVSHSHGPCNMDQAEENDSDDEGEIWYNPIPEDDEQVLSLKVYYDLPSHALFKTVQSPQNRPSGAGDSDSHGGSGLVTNGCHSTEILQLHRQILACKPQEDTLIARTATSDGTEQLNPGFSPPSSPNPSKKGSSINWSFPDKIKSPRTVRKLSMKMKKLPELSRKLSVKGTPTSNSHLEVRANSPKNSCGTEQGQSPGGHYTGQAGGAFSSGNVISRYHLDSSVSTQHSYNMKSSGDIRSPNKGGYLSDGDSPELVAKSGNHCSTSEAKTGKAKDKEHMANNNSGGNGGPKLHGTDLDIDAFRPYSFSEQPKCMQYISGLMSLHFFGAEDLKPPHVDSRDVYCAIQVDSVNKARTALLTCRTTFLDMDHTFNIELENAQHLKLVVFSWEATPRRHRVCCHGTVVLPSLFRVTRTHQLAVRLEPRGMIYVKLGLIEQWQNSLEGPDGEREPHVFGVEAWKVVEREAAGLMVPLLIEKCIVEIEKRGCQVVGLYRLCGSAAVKKELREAFEQDSHSVELLENQYPDINVITGVLKDYLRELPYPLITKQLYEAVLDSMSRRPLRIGAGGCENDPSDSEHTVNLLDILPEVEKVTLRKLLDHLKLVASHHEVNKMTCQNLAVCFGPVLLSQRQDALCHSNRVFIDSEELASALHFKKHIEVLHYLLQLWPVVDQTSSLVVKTSSLIEPALPTDAVAPLRRRRERPQVLNLSEAEMAGMLRPKPGRLDSPCNRYAGDWSSCREAYLKEPREEADYDDIPDYDDTECSEDGKDGPEKQVNPLEPQERLTELEELPKVDAEEKVEVSEKLCETQMTTQDTKNNEHILPHLEQEHLSTEHTYQAYVKIQDISNTVNLKDLQESIDALIGNLERELNKNKLIGY